MEDLKENRVDSESVELNESPLTDTAGLLAVLHR